MAKADDDEALREAALHRGLRLVRSRKRKPGVGDYGKYGLADAQTGEARLGITDTGLTASAEEVAAFLRTSAASSWAQSAEATPDRPKAAPPKAAPSPAPPPEPDRPSPSKAPPAPKPQAKRKPPPAPTRPSKPAPVAEKPTPAPQLALRPARKGDADALATIFHAAGLEIAADEIARAIAAQARAKAPILVAERGAPVGCLAWHPLPTPHRGTLGRITLILVAERERRKGIGRSLLEAAAAAMAAVGCDRIEAISDIEIRNAHGFFRSTGFVQTSYRLARPVSPA